MRISDWSSDVCSSDLDIDHDHTIHEIAGAEQLVQRLFLDVNHHRFLIVAINYGGHATIAAQVTGGSLASPFARLGRQRKMIAHMHIPKTYCTHIRHASRDTHDGTREDRTSQL